MLKSVGIVGIAGLAALRVQSAQAQDIKTIVTRTNAVYSSMKTLKISLQTTTTVDKQSGSDVLTDAQFILPGKKANILMVPKTNGKAMMPSSDGKKLVPTPTGKAGAQVVDDGQASYMLRFENYHYVKQPHNPNMLPILGLKYGLPFGGMDPKAAYFTLQAPATVNGTPCYTLQLAPPTKNVSTTVLIYIDKATYHVKQAKITQTDGKRTVSTQTVVKSETVNAPIPDSAFAFAPPKGAQEVKPPPQKQGK